MIIGIAVANNRTMIWASFSMHCSIAESGLLNSNTVSWVAAILERTFGGAGSMPMERLALLIKQTVTMQFIAHHSAKHPHRSEFTLHLPSPAPSGFLFVFASRVDFD